ncbi:ubiquinol-cytochrome c reductase iron-sulfur subunit [Salinisphaera sp.]|uniref:ubiquinol-cytochrome c reductase iron-sulfur subunit n=1 Tax=Salinisphaera sp. TaxID=1914330 RepID=UPI000C6B0CA4|nr:ubiquinol-cytochrome c reductase iron-sulfur subunit [Salinisphaera sp.]MBS64643.1 ubiquinol-cytochrome c reductase iron-sulfur subunit [Salinisphaera sp.]
MSKEGVDVGKRRFLTTATAAVGGVGAAFVATPFVKSWLPSARARAAGAPVEVNIAALEEGALVSVTWRGKPVWVVRRTPEMLETLDEIAPELADPESKADQQPEYCRNKHRSIEPAVLVMVGICTHLGCSPKYRPEADGGQLSYSGFFCPCHGSKFDIAGRVYSGVPAPLNMVVPPHRYEGDSLIVVGEDPNQGGEEAA